MAQVAFPIAFVFPNQFSIIIYFLVFRVSGVNPLNPPPPGPIYIILDSEPIHPAIKANNIAFVDQVVGAIGTL